MLKMFKGDKKYYFVLYENIYEPINTTLEPKRISFGLDYNIEDKRFSLINGYGLLKVTKVDIYELVFNKKKYIRRNKKENTKKNKILK